MTRLRKNSRSRSQRALSSAVDRFFCEALEDRRLLSVTVVGIPNWVEQGPGSTNGGQDFTFSSNNVSGATNALAAHPTNADILYAATVGGGIWRNTGATSGGNWEPLTDQFPSLSISTIAFSPLDTTVLYAGTSANASGGPVGGPIGILRTTDAGASWTIVAATEFAGTQLLSVIPTAIGTSVADQVVLAGTIGSGLWRSTDGATTFTKISGTLATSDGLDNDADGTIDEAGERNLPNNGNVHIAPDPGNTNRFYAAIAGTGIFRSDNGGANWVQINNGLTGVAGSTRIELSVSAAAGNPVYAGFINGAQQLGNVFRSTDQGGNWAAIGTAPNVNASSAGAQGNLHFSIVADPNDPTLVYVGGDTFASGPFFGNLSRGDSDDGSWTQISVALRTLFTAPHADSRDMVFDANGDILEADDGGVFRLNDPSGLVNTWGNVNGNLRITELYSAAYDHLNDHISGGTQDTGVVDGSVGGGPSAWDEVDQGDGGWASVGYTTVLGIDESIRYTMSNNFGSMRRRAFLSGGIPNPFDSGGVSLNGLNATDKGFTGFSVFPFEANRFDGNRIVIGGNGLYESTDKGDNLTVLNAGGQTSVSAIAYGGSLGGVPNQDILYVGVGGQLFLRSTSGGALNQLTNYTGGTPQDIAMDPDNWKRVYVTDGTNVFRSTDAGVSWARVGSASTVAGSINSIDVFGASTAPDDEIVIIAATNGVFRCRNATAGLNARWSEFGGNLANAPAVDVHYDATDDVVVVGTHGRGAWTMPSASTSLGLTGVLQIDGDQDFNNEPDVIRLVIDAGNPGMLDVFLNSGVPVQVPLSSIEKINIRSFGGDDSITIDGSNGQISVALGTTIDAGADNDVVDASGGDATILGGNGDDAITGSAGPDYISGGAGDDTITAGTGADSVFGDADSDTIIWNNGDNSDVVEGGSGVDILQVNGSTTSGDTFTVSATGARLNFQRTNLIAFTLDSASIEQLDINSGGGTDSITISDVTVTGVRSINIDAGSGTDSITINGRSTADNVVADGSTDVAVIGLAYDINILSASTADTLTIKGNDGNDNLKAQAGVENSIKIVLDGGNGADYLSADATLLGGAGNDTLIGGTGDDSLDGGANDDLLDGRGGSNTLTGGLGNDTILVSGTDANDTITTTHTAGNFNIVGGLSAGSNSISGMERVRIEGAEGDDHININVLSTGGLAYFVLGGNPIGAAGDVLTVISSRAVTYTQGPENDSGSLVAATDVSTNISFDEIEAISISGGPAIINGTNGFDAITIIARDSSTHPGTDGVRDFTVTVNDNPEFLFIDVATLVINALGGSDEIALSTPAPNNADWDVDVTINGGLPAEGDIVIVNTPGDAPETSTFTPTAFDKGNLSIGEATPANASNITLTGVEELIYDGEADGDWLTITGNASNNTIVHEPGAANDEGSLRVDSMLALEYQNMGSIARLQAAGGAGADTLDYHGTIFNDKFTIDTSFVGGRVGLSNRLGLLTSDIETLDVNAQLGDDTTWLTTSISGSPFSLINIFGGEQASGKGDKLNVNTSAGDDDVIINSNTVTAGAVIVNTNGVEEVAIDFRAGNDHLTYNGIDGTSENINLIGSTVAGTGQLSIPGVALYSFQGLETVNVNGNNGALGDIDTFTVTGTNSPDRFEIHLDAAGTAADPVLKLQTLDGANTLLTLINYTNVETLRVSSLDGGDLFNVYTSPANSRDLFVDGGIAAGKKKSTDKLNIFYTPSRPRIIQSVATQDHDAGLVDLLYDNGSRFIIQYLNVENVVIAKL
jgi:Ca2+-binding RTX toxin-like protein